MEAVRAHYGHRWHVHDPELWRTRKRGYMGDGILCGQASPWQGWHYKTNIADVFEPECRSWGTGFCPRCASRMYHRLGEAITVNGKWLCACGGRLRESHRYVAVVDGLLNPDSGEIESPLPNSISVEQCKEACIPCVICDSCGLSADLPKLRRDIERERTRLAKTIKVRG